jgi:uncharacterized protein with beta-barrel porin domain
MNNNLPFYKNKLSSAILMSVLVGAVPFSAQAEFTNICRESENTINTDQSAINSSVCDLPKSSNVTIGTDGALSHVDVKGASEENRTITNKGEISNDSGRGINFSGGGDLTIVNSGTISSSGFDSIEYAQGIYVVGDANSSVIINNSGTISSVSDGVGAAIKVVSGSLVIVNSGTISGSVDGGGAITMNEDIISASIVNKDTGKIEGNIEFVSGTLDVQGGRIIGDVFGGESSVEKDSEVDFTGDFATEGSFMVDNISIRPDVTLTLADNLTGAVSNSGTLYVSRANEERTGPTIFGDYSQLASGGLKIDLASKDSYSQLFVMGSASFASNAKIEVNVIGTPELSIGSTINDIVSVEMGQMPEEVSNDSNGRETQQQPSKPLTSDGTFSVSDNSALFDFTAKLDVNTIDLLIKVAELSVLGSVQKNANSPAAGVAKLMDKLIVESKSTPGLERLITALGELKTEAEVSAAVSQLLPLLTGNQSTALSGGVGAISQVVQSRAEGSQGMSSGDAMPSEKQGQIFDDSYMWLKGFGSMADQGTVGGITGFDADSSGLVIGLDGAPTDKDRIGLAFAYAQTDVDSKDNLNRVDINTYQLVGYGSHSLTDDTQLSYQASYGVHQSEGSRNISIVSTIATSDFDSTSMGAGFGLLHSFKISDQLTITPSLRNDYTYMDNDGYTETGAGSLNLIVDSNDSEQWLFDLSSKAVYRLTESINFTGNLGASYDVINEQSTSLSALAGSPGNVFTTQGLKSDPWLYSAGIGLVMETDSGTKITAHYDYSTRDDFDNQSISLKARWMF